VQLTNTLQRKLDEVKREKMLLEQQIEREHQSNSDLKSSLATIRGTKEDSVPVSGQQSESFQECNEEPDSITECNEREESIPEGDEEQE
jgi:ribosomal protein S13